MRKTVKDRKGGKLRTQKNPTATNVALKKIGVKTEERKTPENTAVTSEKLLGKNEDLP